MTRKSALLAVGFLLVLWGSGSSQVVPDGLVYTELEKTLVQGSRGILTCRFYKDPVAVFWKRGPNPDDSSSMLLWHEGTVSGPKYDDGTYDIDGNSYSLIIKNVSKADTGRFYCRVSNYMGILIINHTDVFVVDTAMETKSHITLQMRPKLHGILQCIVHIRPRTVTWTRKGMVSSSNETLVTLENVSTNISRSGAGYDQGIVNITEDYSLIIHDVQVQSEGLYVCAVTDFDTGITFRADTPVNVVAAPLEPFPSILECPQDSSDPGYCSLLVKAETTLTCQVRDYYPDITLQFFHGSEAVEKVLNTSEITNTDGTKSKSIEIAASESKELYTCVAINVPGTHGNISTSVLVHGEAKLNSTVLVIIVILLASVILIVSVVCIIQKRRLNAKSNEYKSVELADTNEGEKSGENCFTKDNIEEIILQVKKLSVNHCKKLLGVIAPSDMDQLANVYLENNATLFDIQQMCNEWQHELQRTKKHQDTIVMLQMEMTDYAWPTDKEIDLISSYFNESSMVNVCNNLKIDRTSRQGFTGEKGFKRLLCEWRDKKAAASIIDTHKQLISALKLSDLGGLLPHRRGLLMYKVELVDVAFELILQDLLPLTKTLGIGAAKLLSYRQAFNESHLSERNSTIGLLLTVFTKASAFDNERNYFYSKIQELQYRKVAINRMIGYEMSYGEVYAISTAAANAIKESSTVLKRLPEHAECATEHHDDTNTPCKRPAPVKEEDPAGGDDSIIMSPGNDLLKNILHLTAEDIAYCLGHVTSPEMITDYALLKVWKEMPRLALFNYRAELAKGLQNVKLENMADEVISGKYINGQTSLHFIQDLVQEMDESQLKTLGELLKLHGHDSGNIVWWKSSGCQLTVEWVANWTQEMKGFKLTDRIPFRKETTKRHRDFNDQLVEHGFLELAREIMILEQQID